MHIKYSSYFAKKFGQLPTQIQMAAIEKEKMLIEDPFCEQLQTIALSGNLVDYYTFAIDQNYRILGTFVSNNELHLVDVDNYLIFNN